MRIWDIEPKYLCRSHLLGEHRELHALWSIITENKSGYKNHPETMRWIGKLRALYQRHQAEVSEMKRRGYNHNSSLDPTLAVGQSTQDILIDPIERQIEILKSKNCYCSPSGSPRQ